MRFVFLPIVLLAGLSALATADPIVSTDWLQLTDLGAGVNPTAINNVGQVVGQAANSQAFLWQGGTTTPLGTLGGTQSYANDINDSGVAVGWSYDSSGNQKAFSWSSGTMTNIGAASSAASAAEAINSSGDIVGWRTNGTAYRSVLWDAADPNGLTLFNSQGDTKGLGINDARVIVGITLAADHSPSRGYFWDGTGSGATYTSAFAAAYFPFAGIANTNMTAGMQLGNGAFLDIGGTAAVRIGKLLPSDASSTINGLNDSTQFVGESDGKGLFYESSTGQLFDADSFSRTTAGFGQILRLNEINNSDQFVGVALIDGVEHGIVGQLLPTPEPSSFLLAALGFAALLGPRCRRYGRKATV